MLPVVLPIVDDRATQDAHRPFAPHNWGELEALFETLRESDIDGNKGETLKLEWPGQVSELTRMKSIHALSFRRQMSDRAEYSLFSYGEQTRKCRRVLLSQNENLTSDFPVAVLSESADRGGPNNAVLVSSPIYSHPPSYIFSPGHMTQLRGFDGTIDQFPFEELSLYAALLKSDRHGAQPYGYEFSSYMKLSSIFKVLEGRVGSLFSGNQWLEGLETVWQFSEDRHLCARTISLDAPSRKVLERAMEMIHEKTSWEFSTALWDAGMGQRSAFPSQ